MNQMSFDPWANLENQRRNEKLIKEAEQSRLAYETEQPEIAKTSGTLKILSLIVKELTTLGTIFDKRNPGKSDIDRAFMQNSQSSGCS